MRNFVAKNNFNRASTHPDRTKYKRSNQLDYWDEYYESDIYPDKNKKDKCSDSI